MYNTSPIPPIQYWRLHNLDGLHELSSNSHQLKISCPLILNKAWNKAKAHTLGPLPYNTQWCGFNGRFPFNPKFRKFRTMHQTERTISVIFGTRFDRSGYLGRLDRNVPFHLTKLLSPVPLFCILQPNARCLGSGLCHREGLFHWARGISEISHRNFYWMESAQYLSHMRKTNEG